jgi:hypothetical protein
MYVLLITVVRIPSILLAKPPIIVFITVEGALSALNSVRIRIFASRIFESYVVSLESWN